MELKFALESGIIDEFCLGLLDENLSQELANMAKQYAEVEFEIQKTFSALAQYASVEPNHELQPKIEGIIKDLILEENLIKGKLPNLHKYSDQNIWNTYLKNTHPEIKEENLSLTFLVDLPERQLCLAWLSTNLFEEGHEKDEFQESFFILEGTCECNIDGHIFQLSAGDFLEIPAGKSHNIKNTSKNIPFVKALIQRVKSAA